MSTATISRVKGMYDIVPEKIDRWHRVEQAATRLFDRYGYHELRLPLLEKTALFSGAIGESTDVVSKEMYSFEDRNGDHLALRPEGTASAVRAAIQNGLLQGHARKIWYGGPMFRRENVQRGRHRQFYQLGAEIYGPTTADADAELVIMLARLWKELGYQGLRLEVNSLGSNEARAAYRQTLVEYMSDHRDQLDQDSLRRLELNPLRILDSKNPDMQPLVAAAPSVLQSLDAESVDHFEQFKALLDAAGVGYSVNERLVRGLDYYNRTVFEWITEDLGSQAAVCAGGRYDGLIERQGGPSCAAVGFAMGVDRLVALMEEQDIAGLPSKPDAYMIIAGSDALSPAVKLSESLREAVPELKLQINLAGGSFKAQFKRADKSGAAYALVLGENEIKENQVTVKPLRDQNAQQQSLGFDQLVAFLRNHCVSDCTG